MSTNIDILDAGIAPPDDNGNETSEADYEKEEEENDDADNEDNDDGDNAAGTDAEEAGNDGDDGEKSDNEMDGGEEEDEGKEAAGGNGVYEMIRKEEEALDRNGGTSTLHYYINLITFLFFIYRSVDTKLKVQIQERQEFSHTDSAGVRRAPTRRSRQRRQWRAGHVCG